MHVSSVRPSGDGAAPPKVPIVQCRRSPGRDARRRPEWGWNPSSRSTTPCSLSAPTVFIYEVAAGLRGAIVQAAKAGS
jgi:hypothetical protein